MSGNQKKQAEYGDFVTISDAAQLLGVSIDTVRRWEKAGKITAERLDGKNRYFDTDDLHSFLVAKGLTTTEVAEHLGISQSTVRRLEKRGELIPRRESNGRRVYELEAVHKLLDPNLTLQKEIPKNLHLTEEVIEDAHVDETFKEPARYKNFMWSLPTFFSRQKGTMGQAGVFALMLISIGVLFWLLPSKQANVSNNGLDSKNGLTRVQLTSSGDLIIPDKGLIVNLNSEFVQGYVPGDKNGNLSILPITSDEIADGAIQVDHLSKEVQDLLKNGGTTVAIGPVGPKGTDGQPGANGTNGAAGAAGPAGLTGPPGTNGTNAALAAEEGDTSVVGSVSVIDFASNDFSVSQSPLGEANIAIDYTNSGITRRTAAEAISGNWVFTNGIWQGNIIGTTYGGTGINGSAATNGQLLIGNGSGYSLANLSQGSGVTIANSAGGITISSTLGTSISSGEIEADSVALGSQTTGTYASAVTAGNGISVGGSAGEGWSPTISTLYGAAANTAVQGNVTLTCSSGTGNLSGGGNAITLGSGGTCNSLGISTTPTFTTVSTTNLSINGDTFTDLTGTGLSTAGGVLQATLGTSIGNGEIDNDAVALGTQTTGNYIQSIVAGNGITGDTANEGATATLAVGAGNGIAAAADSISVAVQANKGLEVDVNGLSFVDCSSGEILKYNGSNQWACSNDNIGGVSDGDKGDLTVSGSGTIWTIDNGAVTNVKLQNSSINLTYSGNVSGDASVALGGTLNVGFSATPNFTSVSATTFTGSLTGNASTASALAANPTDCSSNQFANAIAANGNLTCSVITDADVSDTLTASNFVGSGSTTNAVDLGTAEIAGVLADGNVSDTLTSSLFVGSGSTTTAIDLATAEVAGNLLANNLQNAAADLGAADVTINFGNTNGAFNTNITTDGSITAASFIGALTGNSSTATALAANPSDCSANQFATTIAANGNLTCAALTDGDIPNSITIDLATAANALANDPTDCGANTFARQIASNGNLTCFGVVDADVSDTLTIGASSTVADGALSSNVTKLGSSIQNSEVDDDLTISASGSVNDAALSANVTKLGAAIDLNTSEVAGQLQANKLQNAAADLGAANVTIDLSNTNGAFNTNLVIDGSITSPTFTSTGAVELSSTGGANDLTLTSGSNIVNLNATSVKTTAGLLFDLSNAVNTVLSISNSGAGVASLNVSEGSIQTAGSTRITNGGALQNVSADTGILTSGTLGAARGGTGLNGSAAANGSLLIGNGSGYSLSTLTQGSGISIANASGSITVESTLGTSISNGEIDANAVTLGTQTSGNYVGSLGALTGLSTTGNTGEGSTPTLAVEYGSTADTAVEGNTTLTVSAGAGLSGGSTITLGSGGTATLAVQYGSTGNTAVQGNTTLTCPSGTGNLTGGGGTITLGTGGSCGAISTNSAVSFSSSVTTPIVQNAGTLSLGTTATAGADDIIFNTAGGEVVRILENGDLKFEKGTNDVTFTVAAPGAPATYTFSGVSGTVLTNANYAGTLDAVYVNTGESPAAGDIAGSFSGGLTINSDAVTTAKILNANVTNAKLANSSLTVTAGTGLSGGGSVALGGSTSLAVQYGAAAGTAVQGNTTLICNSGSGNLTGGGGTITLGTGGSCGALTTNNAVNFTTSVTTPLVTNAGVLSVSTTGLNDLTLASGSNTININATKLKTTANIALDLNSGSNTTLSVTNDGSGIASLSVEGGVTVGNLLTVTTGGFSVTGNSTIAGTLSGLTGLTVASGGANITGTGTFSSAVVVGNTFTNTTGAIRWTGADFQGFDGAVWKSLTGGGGGGGSPAKLMASYTHNSFNLAASATTILFPTQANGAAAVVTNAAGSGDIRMPSAGSIRACTVVSSTAVTGGTASIRFRKNGAQFDTTNYCQLSTTQTRTVSQELASTAITFAAGDTIGVQVVTAALAPAGSLDLTATFTVEFGSASPGSAFTNGGNSFGANSTLGNADNFGLSFLTNNTTVLNLATSGLASFSGAVTSAGALTVSAGGASITGGLNLNSGGLTNAGSITGVGTNITATGALTVASGGAGNLTLDSASNILSIAANDTTLQRSAAGTFTIDLANNTVTTLAVDNSTAGSTNLDLVDGALQTAGTTRLTNAGVLQNITGLTVTGGGASITGGATINGNTTLGATSADRLTVNSQILGSSPLVFQGATDNGFATTLLFSEPTANNTITVPDASGTLVLSTRNIQTAANSGLSGGGNLGADLALSLDINNLNSITTTSNSDYLAVYDSNTSAVKKVSRSDFLQGIIGALIYRGTWNAATNTPMLSDASGVSGDEYVVSVGATRDLGSGNIVFSAGDFIIHNGTRWEVAPSSSAVSSVFGRTGGITAQNGDYTAVQITNTPAGTIAATTVQAALNELDSEKLSSLNGLTATTQTFANDPNVTISSVGSTHTLGWAGQLSVGRGGTGAGSFTANGVIYGNGSGTLQVTAAGTSGQTLIANASGVPTFVSLSGDISVTAAGLTAITADSVNLGADTAGNYVASFGSLTGLSATGNTGEGSTPTLSVAYGNSANTAVQGSVTLTCASGAGNLTGGGTIITLGSGGACGALSSVGNPTFANSVTTPILQSSSSLSLTSGGSADILLDSSSNQISLAADDTTLQRVAAGTFTIDLSDSANTVLAITNSGAGVASLSVEGGAIIGANVNITSGGITVTGNSSITGTLTGLTGLTVASGGASISGGLNNNSGGITNGGNISGTDSVQSVNNTNLTIDAQGTGSIVFTGYNCSGGVNGGALTVNASGVVACSDDDGILSDARLKKDVVSLDDSILDKIKDVRTVNFDFDCDNAFFTERILDCRTAQQTGVIAQELAQIFPELVYEADDGYYRVKYDALSIYTLKGLIELNQKVDSLSMDSLEGAGLEIITQRVVANELETSKIVVGGSGLEFVNSSGEKIASIDGLGNLTANSIATTQQPAAGAADSSSGDQLNLDNLTVGALNVDLDLLARGGLVVEGNAQFRGATIFDSLVTFGDSLLVKGDATFEGTATFNNNAGGYAVINTGSNSVHVRFNKPYIEIPIITISLNGNTFVNYTYTNLTESGFDININEPSTSDLKFSWIATSINNPRTF